MSERHAEIIARIGLAGAIVPTYATHNPRPMKTIQKHLNAIEQFATAAIRFFGKASPSETTIIDDKIKKMRRRSCLGKSRSILTFIDFSIEILETSLSGYPPLANLNGAQGRVYIKCMIQELLDLRSEISGKRNFEICSMAGIRAAEIWGEL